MSLLYSSMLIHGFLPDAMIITIIALIIKNKAGDLSCNNCRPITLATIASKLFESLILSRVSTFVTTCVNQFGFKNHHSKNIHPVVINNHTLPHTEKCKYLGHIINNNLTDDDDIARQKICIYMQANVLARKCTLCNSSNKTTLFNSYCDSMYTSSL